MPRWRDFRLAPPVEAVYRSTDGGAHWASIVANPPAAPASSLVVDPQSGATVYVATDAGVYSTTQVASWVMRGRHAGRRLEPVCRKRRWWR